MTGEGLLRLQLSTLPGVDRSVPAMLSGGGHSNCVVIHAGHDYQEYPAQPCPGQTRVTFDRGLAREECEER
jgi:hypothetical protein